MSGYPSLSGPYLYDGSYIMEMGSTISLQVLNPRRNLSGWEYRDYLEANIRYADIREGGRPALNGALKEQLRITTEISLPQTRLQFGGPRGKHLDLEGRGEGVRQAPNRARFDWETQALREGPGERSLRTNSGVGSPGAASRGLVM